MENERRLLEEEGVDPENLPHSKIKVDIRQHHCLAAVDDFSLVSAHWDLFPGAKLVYIHDFPQMYNAISQVVYFHNPAYQKRIQERVDVEGLSVGLPAGHAAVHVLPCIMQLYPNIKLLFEEDRFDLGALREDYAWVLAARRIYLLAPDGKVYYDKNFNTLLQFYLLTRQGTDAG